MINSYGAIVLIGQSAMIFRYKFKLKKDFVHERRVLFVFMGLKMKKLLLVLSLGMGIGDLVAVSDNVSKASADLCSYGMIPDNFDPFDQYSYCLSKKFDKGETSYNRLKKTDSVEQEVSIYPYSEGDAVYTESEWNVWDNIIKPYFKKSEPAKSENVSSESAVQSVAAESVVQEIAQPVAETKAQNDVCLKQSNTQHVVGGAIAATIVVYTTYKIVKYAFGKWKNYAAKKQFLNQ